MEISIQVLMDEGMSLIQKAMNNTSQREDNQWLQIIPR